LSRGSSEAIAIKSDDKPLLDRMNMKANSIWRESYNGADARFFIRTAFRCLTDRATNSNEEMAVKDQ
jgi:hypothetical protein